MTALNRNHHQDQPEEAPERTREDVATAPLPSLRGERWRQLQETVRRLAGGYGEPALRPCQPTGLAALDAVLPGGGLPVGAVTECLGEAGDGRSRFALWFLRSCLAQASAAPALLVERPSPVAATAGRTAAQRDDTHARWRWYPPALAQAGVALERLLVVRAGTEREALWAAEQGLLAGVFSVLVLPELHRGLDATAVRRLQLAAQESRAVVLLPRPLSAQGVPSAAAVRLRFEAAAASEGSTKQPQQVRLHVLRSRGGRAGHTVELSFPVLDPFAASSGAPTHAQPQSTVVTSTPA